MILATAVLIWQYWPKSQAMKTPLPTDAMPMSEVATFGRPSADAVVVVFTDFQCPYCARFATGPLRDFRNTHVTSGRASVIVRHYPLDQIHPEATPTAVAAECARQQNQFDAFHDYVFERQGNLAKLASDRFAQAIETLRLDHNRFSACLESADVRKRIRADSTMGSRLGVPGTPTVFVGKRVDRGVQLMRRLDGQLTLETLEEAMDQILTGSLAPATHDFLRSVILPATLVSLAIGAVILVRRRAGRGKQPVAV